MGRHSAPDDDGGSDAALGVLVAPGDVGGLAGLPNGGRPARDAQLLDLTDGVHAYRDEPPPDELVITPDQAGTDQPRPDAEPVLHPVEAQMGVPAELDSGPDVDGDAAGDADVDSDADAWWAGDAAVIEQPAYEPPPATMDPTMDPGGYVPDSGSDHPVPVFTPYWAADAPPPPDDPGAFAPLDPQTGAPVDQAGFVTPDPATLPVGEPAAPVPARAHSTAADIRLIRTRSDVRARVLAGLFVPFVLYIVVLALIGANGRQYLIFLFIPLVLAGVLVGAFLDLGHRNADVSAAQPTSSPSLPAP